MLVVTGVIWIIHLQVVISILVRLTLELSLLL